MRELKPMTATVLEAVSGVLLNHPFGWYGELPQVLP